MKGGHAPPFVRLRILTPMASTLKDYLASNSERYCMIDESAALRTHCFPSNLDTKHACSLISEIEGLASNGVKGKKILYRHHDSAIYFFYTHNFVRQLAPYQEEELVFKGITNRIVLGIWPHNSSTKTLSKVSLVDAAMQRNESVSHKVRNAALIGSDESTDKNALQKDASLASAQELSLLNYLMSRDDYSFEHSIRVGKYCASFSDYLVKQTDGIKSSETMVDNCRSAGMLHDIGKIYCRDRHLNSKKNYNTDETPDDVKVEFKKIINRHSVMSVPLIYPFYYSSLELTIIPVLMHHVDDIERCKQIISGFQSSESFYDVEDIYDVISIIRLCDSLDAMTHARPYRPAPFPDPFSAIYNLYINDPQKRQTLIPSEDIRSHLQGWASECRTEIDAIYNIFPYKKSRPKKHSA